MSIYPPTKLFLSLLAVAVAVMLGLHVGVENQASLPAPDGQPAE